MKEHNETSAKTGLTGFEVASITIWFVGLFGLGALALIRWALGIPMSQFMASSAGSIAVWIFSGLFVLGSLILHPFAVWARRWTK